MALVSEDVPSAGGPSGNLPQGEQTQFQQDRKTMESAGSSNPPSQQPHPGGQPPQGPQGPQPQAAPPVQPQPTPQPTPNTPSFSEPKLQPKYPWQQELQTWASHPDAGPALKRLLALVQQRHPGG